MTAFSCTGRVPHFSFAARIARLGGAVALALGGLSFAWAVPLAPPAAGALTVVPGRVVGWGYNAQHQVDIPAEAQSGVTRVAGGCGHSVALKSGKVIAWGDDTLHQTEVPAAAQSGVTAISAGCQFTLALKSNGTVVGWGDNSVHQIDIPTLSSGWKWFAIGAGDFASIGLASDGANELLFRWGNVPNVIAGSTAADGESGQNAYVVLKKDGTVQTGGTGPASLLASPPGLSNVVGIDVGRLHALALKHTSVVVAWGDDAFGQIDVPSGLGGVIQVAAGGYHSLALRSDGTIVAWGRNDYGQATVPAAPAGLHYSFVAGGILHSLAIASPSAPGPPTDATATAWDGAATVAWQAPADNGGSPITGYTVTSAPDGKTCTTTGAVQCTVGGLSNGTAYTFTVKAINAAGTGPASASSGAVTPMAAATPPPTSGPTETATPGSEASGAASPSSSSGGGGGGVDLTLLLIGVIIGVAIALVAFTAYQLGKPRGPKRLDSAETPPSNETAEATQSKDVTQSKRKRTRS
jgi:hypothetical protein